MARSLLSPLVRTFTVIVLLLAAAAQNSGAAKLVDVRVVDKDYLEAYFKDGDVTFVDDGRGSTAFLNLAHDATKSAVVSYGTALNLANAFATASWKIVSPDDAAYGTAGLAPTNCSRKSKLNGMYEGDWSGSDYVYQHTMEHHIFLNLPGSLVQGKTYTLQISAATNTDSTSKTFTYDIYNSRSEAVHVNLVGYSAAPSIKAADLYAWFGNGGPRDYSSLVGNKVYLVDVATKTPQQVGTVSLWKTSASEAQGYNFTGSNVWKADFTGFNTPGTYRLAVEGVGCSQDFVIADAVYHDPFMVAVRGFFYMRIGQDSAGIRPVPRRPLYIPGKNPANTVVYITTMQPSNAGWSTFTSGDKWDNPDAWATYSTGRTNALAYGGHADAADWDRHMGHISNIYDMLLPYILTGGSISDDNLGIAESGNGVPDIIDEARNEVDFWLRLRDGQAYGYGLTNPNSSNVFYQAGTSAVAAWAAAAGSAMLAEAYRIAGQTTLMNAYRDSAINAYSFAGTLADQMLDFKQDAGETTLRGRDLKMTAAACLYNLTGTTAYEDVVNSESKATNAAAAITDPTNFDQIWATAAYLKTNRTVHYQTLYNNMKSSVISDAKNREANYINSRPSRRSSDNNTQYFHTEIHVDRTIVAHAVATVQADKDLFENALILEADWSLGRNPANLIQMSTASTPLSTRRSIEAMYTSGGNDGTPGQHPGHTPYLNTDDWGGSMVMGKPSWLAAFSYPDNATWPKGEVWFNTRHVYAHSEFTPQQTMRGKIALYGYLYGIRSGTNTVPRNQPAAGNTHGQQPYYRILRLANGNIRITFLRETGGSGARGALYDCSGKLAKAFRISERHATNYSIQTSSLSKGIYYLEIIRDGKKAGNTVAVY